MILLLRNGGSRLNLLEEIKEVNQKLGRFIKKTKRTKNY